VIEEGLDFSSEMIQQQITAGGGVPQQAGSGSGF
jgi:hypothetical protein